MAFARLKIVILIFMCISISEGYNIEVKKVGISTGALGSDYGYTVSIVRKPGWTHPDLFRNDFFEKELLVGAPKSNYSNIRSHGQVFECSNPREKDINCQSLNLTDISNFCDKLRREGQSHCAEDSRLGATMAVNLKFPQIQATTSTTPMITVCAPAWKNVFPETDEKLYQNYMMGMCLKLRDNLRPINCSLADRSYCWPFWPYRDLQLTDKGRPAFTYAQGGMSATFTQNGRSEIVGGPGADDWRGAYIAHQAHYEKRLDTTSTENTIYFSYALTTGALSEQVNDVIVVGAPNWYQPPRYGHFGKVELYKGTSKWDIISYGIPRPCKVKSGLSVEEFKLLVDTSQTGSKFGAALATIDITGDGYSEIFVGAPLYTGQYPEEGRVFVYTTETDQWGSLHICGPIAVLSGGAHIPSLKELTSYSRFGTSIVSAGDLDQDGYNDVAIGSPYEDNGSGAVYIYSGIGTCDCKMDDKFTQRITGKGIDPGIRSFGWSLYGNEDIDNNGFSDLAVGAYASDTAVMFRSRPIVKVFVQVKITPDPIPLNGSLLACSLDNVSLCFNVTVLFAIESVGDKKNIVSETTLQWELRADTVHNDKEGWSRVGFRETNGLDTQIENITLSLNGNKNVVRNYTLDVKGYNKKPEPKDAWTIVRMEGSYELVETSGDVFSELDPILHKDVERQISEAVEFDKKCDRIDECTSDLKLLVDVHMLKSDGSAEEVNNETVIYVGVANQLEVSADVKNLYNSSYRSHFKGRVSALMRRDISSNNGVIGSECEYSSPDNINTYINCTADSKLDQKENFKVKTYFDISTNQLVQNMDMKNLKESVKIELEAFQANKDTNPANNIYSREIPVKLKYVVIINADEETSDQERFKADENSQRRIAITHRFFIFNQGPSFLPMTYVNISVPLMKDGAIEVKKMSQECLFRNAVRQTTTTTATTTPTSRQTIIPAESEKYRRRRSADETSQAVSAQDTKDKSGAVSEKNITCKEYECVVIECKVTNLLKNTQKMIDIEIDVKESHLAKEKGVQIVRFVSNATVTDPSVWFGGKVIPWERTVYSEKWTTFVVEPASVVSEVNIWIIIGSVLGAIFLLALVIFILWKCGFFKRKKHGQVEQWKKASLYNRKSMRLSSTEKQSYSPIEEKDGNKL